MPGARRRRHTCGRRSRRAVSLAHLPAGLLRTCNGRGRPAADLGQIWWTAVATASGDPTLAAANRDARRTLTIASVMSLMLAGAVIVALARRADGFGSRRHARRLRVGRDARTQTPLANLRAINETLASGRSTPEMVREYAHMGIGEATRLTRLVDNLLAYSRVTDVADVYSFEPVSLR